MKSFDVVSIARVCHEVNRAYCATLGDHTQPRWDDATEWLRNSYISGVEFQLANPHAHPSASHEAWMRHKQAEGWKYGPVKDAEKKEHPCFLSYSELPEAQRRKDHLFKATVAAMTAQDREALPSADAFLEIIQSVDVMRAEMLAQLAKPENREKGDRAGWMQAKASSLMDCLDRNVDELARMVEDVEIGTGIHAKADIRRRAANVANFAMMIAERCTEPVVSVVMAGVPASANLPAIRADEPEVITQPVEPSAQTIRLGLSDKEASRAYRERIANMKPVPGMEDLHENAKRSLEQEDQEPPGTVGHESGT